MNTNQIPNECNQANIEETHDCFGIGDTKLQKLIDLFYENKDIPNNSQKTSEIREELIDLMIPFVNSGVIMEEYIDYILSFKFT